jgi:hypothetical protein
VARPKSLSAGWHSPRIRQGWHLVIITGSDSRDARKMCSDVLRSAFFTSYLLFGLNAGLKIGSTATALCISERYSDLKVSEPSCRSAGTNFWFAVNRNRQKLKLEGETFSHQNSTFIR